VGVIAAMSTGRHWDNCEPEFVLVGHIVHLACKDALQTKNEGRQKEAWEFLESFAPDIAERLRKATEERENNYDRHND
jgi:hypothetical protein